MSMVVHMFLLSFLILTCIAKKSLELHPLQENVSEEMNLSKYINMEKFTRNEVLRYSRGPKTGCEDNSIQVANPSECEQAAQALNVRYWGGSGHSSGADPKGCIYRIPDKDIYFNTHSTGSLGRNDRQLICESSATSECDIPADSQISVGFQYLQIGEWRLGDPDGRHFSIAHKDGYTAMIYRSDGTIHPGPRICCGLDQLSTWKSSTTPSGVKFGDKFVQIGEWRLGDPDGTHFSIAHRDGYTAEIFRSDGTVHHGPRNCCGLWQLNTFSQSFKDIHVQFGNRTLQLGEWRLGAPDGTHFSIAHRDGYTAEIFRSDGTVHNGPRNCCGLWQLNTYENRPVIKSCNAPTV